MNRRCSLGLARSTIESTFKIALASYLAMFSGVKLLDT